MIIEWPDVLGFAPELSDVDETAQEDILAYVNETLNVSAFGGETHPKTRLARILLAAHFGTLALSNNTGSAGPVVSESAGGLSRTYGALFTSGGDPGFDRTSYGQTYRSLVHTSLGRLPFAI